VAGCCEYDDERSGSCTTKLVSSDSLGDCTHIKHDIKTYVFHTVVHRCIQRLFYNSCAAFLKT
jgi:hypothetical protein